MSGMNKARLAREIIRALKDAPAVTGGMVTVDHVTELQPGDVVLSVSDPEVSNRATVTVIRAEPKP